MKQSGVMAVKKIIIIITSEYPQKLCACPHPQKLYTRMCVVGIWACNQETMRSSPTSDICEGYKLCMSRKKSISVQGYNHKGKNIYSK